MKGNFLGLNRKPDRLDLDITDSNIILTRNFNEDSKGIIIQNDNSSNKLFVEFLDAMLHPGKHELHIHDIRKKNVYSKISYSIESLGRAEDH